MSVELARIRIANEQDVVLARQMAGRIAGLLGFDRQDIARIGTSVSELARNAFRYAGGGRVDFLLANGQLCIEVNDRGPGIPNLDAVLSGEHVSKTGMGRGLLGTRRIMDAFAIDTGPEGTRVRIGKTLPPDAPPETELGARLKQQLDGSQPGNPYEEVQRQNQELLEAMAELRRRQEELQQANRALRETNLAITALSRELEEKADGLKRNNDLRARFMSHLSHEFRTPLSAVIGLADLLLDEVDGPINEEQRKQLGYIRSSGQSLLELVNDLLDLAKIEAGRMPVKKEPFLLESLLTALRGMFRPMSEDKPAVELVIDPAPDKLPPLETDESKVAQILRNLVSNALKFTHKGKVRLSTRYNPETDRVRIRVSDTGIGIAAEDQERVFAEYAQVDNPIQQQVRGTGLGLPISRKLARALGGDLTLASSPGQGSTFTLELPRVLPPEPASEKGATGDQRLRVLLVDDEDEMHAFCRQNLDTSRYRLLSARTLVEARELLRRETPDVILLDLLLGDENGLTLLQELRHDEHLAEIPVLVLSILAMEKESQALGAIDFALKPIDRHWLNLRLQQIETDRPLKTILHIDDEEVSRYLLQSLLGGHPCTLLQAASGVEGLQLAREHQPDLIFLDLSMPGMDGFTVLETLRRDPKLKNCAVIVLSSHRLDAEQQQRLRELHADYLGKHDLSRQNLAGQLENILRQRGGKRGEQ
ncbi:MAG: ATP-binding protein [Geothermobacteraceae bacterium]